MSAELILIDNGSTVNGKPTSPLMWRFRTSSGSNAYMAGPVSLPDGGRNSFLLPRCEKAKAISEDEALFLERIVCPGDHPFEAEVRLGFAIQAEARGMKNLSNLMRSGKDVGLGPFDFGGTTTPIETRLYRMAFEDTLAAFMKPHPDRKALTERLEALARRLPASEFSPNDWLVSSQRAALAPCTSSPGTTEYLVDSWIQLTGSGYEIDVRDKSLDAVLSRGLSIAPTLIAHLNDPRATLHHVPPCSVI